MSKKKSEVVLPPKPFDIGEKVHVMHKPLLYRIPDECTVIELKPGGMSGWLVGIETSAGLKHLDSSYIKRLP